MINIDAETFICVALVIAGLYAAISEATGTNHLQYSKFRSIGTGFVGSGDIKIPGKIGMLIFYTPALLVGISSFLLFPGGGDVRFLMLKSAITIHFLKRDLEVLFLHKYSGNIALFTTLMGSSAYFLTVVGLVYFQHLAQGFEPSVDLKYIGLVLYLVGILGNFYHHLLLAKLRNKSDEGYKIPTGGLFSLVTCPHYLFEIISFVGISFISQTLFSYASTLASALYLLGRSYATRKWYLSKFDNFPKNVKALIPFVF